MMTHSEEHLQQLRSGFSALHASNHPSTEKIVAKLTESVIAHSGNTFFEAIQSVSYNPEVHLLEAVIAAKKDFGYNGSLCTEGSYAFVRFYLDYGRGWEDQGYSAVNEHDIPTGLDCKKHNEKPISYAVSLKIAPKTDKCSVNVLPKVRAVLEWNKIPPPNTPNYVSIWGNTFNDFIQIKPYKPLIVINPIYNQLVELVTLFPSLKLTDAAKVVPGGELALAQIKDAQNFKLPELSFLARLYESNEVTVSTARFGLQHALQIINSYSTNAVTNGIDAWEKVGIDFNLVMGELEKINADVAYEQIESVGLDYNLEQVIASFRVKKPAGYSGDLCSQGSLEYVAFWADWGNNCQWEYLGTTSVNVHDIHNIPSGGVSYAAILPYDFSKLRKFCSNPEVVKIRAVLSWGVAPSITDAEKLQYWGNRLDAYIQIKPGVNTGILKPSFNILGGIPVDKINDATGLTLPGAKFALNQVGVNDQSPFGGVIVLQGPAFAGHKYRIKVTNENTLATYYINNDLVVVGWLAVPPYVQYTTVQANPVTFYYNYQPFDKNTENVLARFSPGTDDLLKLDLEIEGVPGVFTKYIQMDNHSPVINLQIDDMGDCSHYKAGQDITGSYAVNDMHLLDYSLVSSFGGTVNGTSNLLDTFTFHTTVNGSPCGKIALSAVEKTIYDSQWTNNSSYNEQIICLQQDKKQ
jgi:hypothetical protein